MYEFIIANVEIRHKGMPYCRVCKLNDCTHALKAGEIYRRYHQSHRPEWKEVADE